MVVSSLADDGIGVHTAEARQSAPGAQLGPVHSVLHLALRSSHPHSPHPSPHPSPLPVPIGVPGASIRPSTERPPPLPNQPGAHVDLPVPAARAEAVARQQLPQRFLQGVGSGVARVHGGCNPGGGVGGRGDGVVACGEATVAVPHSMRGVQLTSAARARWEQSWVAVL